MLAGIRATTRELNQILVIHCVELAVLLCDNVRARALLVLYIYTIYVLRAWGWQEDF